MIYFYQSLLIALDYSVFDFSSFIICFLKQVSFIKSFKMNIIEPRYYVLCYLVFLAKNIKAYLK